MSPPSLAATLFSRLLTCPLGSCASPQVLHFGQPVQCRRSHAGLKHISLDLKPCGTEWTIGQRRSLPGGTLTGSFPSSATRTKTCWLQSPAPTHAWTSSWPAGEHHHTAWGAAQARQSRVYWILPAKQL